MSKMLDNPVRSRKNITMFRTIFRFGVNTLNRSFFKKQSSQYYYAFYRSTVKPLNYNSNVLKIVPTCSRKKFECENVALAFSLLTLLGLEKETDEDVIITNIKRSIILIQKKEYYKAEQMLHLALRMAQQTLNGRATTYIYDVMANLAMETEQFEKAEILFSEVMKRLFADGVKEHDVKNIHISLKMARMYHLRGDLEKAQIGFNWCLTQLEKYNRNHQDIEILFGMAKDWYGHLLIDKGLYEAAGVQLCEAYEILENFKDDNLGQLIVLLNDIAITYEMLENLDKAEELLKKAKALGKETPLMEELGPVHVNLGKIYIKKKIYDLGRKSCGFAYRIAKDNNDKTTMKEAKFCVHEAEKLKQ